MNDQPKHADVLPLTGDFESPGQQEEAAVLAESISQGRRVDQRTLVEFGIDALRRAWEIVSSQADLITSPESVREAVRNLVMALIVLGMPLSALAKEEPRANSVDQAELKAWLNQAYKKSWEVFNSNQLARPALVTLIRTDGVVNKTPQGAYNIDAPLQAKEKFWLFYAVAIPRDINENGDILNTRHAVEVRWHHNGREQKQMRQQYDNVEASQRYRLWSSYRLPKAGQWTFELLVDGKSVYSQDFTVHPSPFATRGERPENASAPKKVDIKPRFDYPHKGKSRR